MPKREECQALAECCRAFTQLEMWRDAQARELFGGDAVGEEE
jgi:hypothetical protein